MRNLSTRWLDQRTFSAGDTMSLSEALDVGDYGSLELVITVEQAATGSSPALVVEHAALNGADRYLAFDPAVSVDLTQTGTTWLHRSPFTRPLGWSLSGTLETDAVVSIDVVAKA